MKNFSSSSAICFNFYYSLFPSDRLLDFSRNISSKWMNFSPSLEYVLANLCYHQKWIFNSSQFSVEWGTKRGLFEFLAIDRIFPAMHESFRLTYGWWQNVSLWKWTSHSSEDSRITLEQWWRFLFTQVYSLFAVFCCSVYFFHTEESSLFNWRVAFEFPFDVDESSLCALYECDENPSVFSHTYCIESTVCFETHHQSRLSLMVEKDEKEQKRRVYPLFSWSALVWRSFDIDVKCCVYFSNDPISRVLWRWDEKNLVQFLLPHFHPPGCHLRRCEEKLGGKKCINFLISHSICRLLLLTVLK